MIIKNVKWVTNGQKEPPCDIVVPTSITRNPELQERWALENYLTKWLTETYKMGYSKFSLSGYGEYHPNKKPDLIAVKALVELMEPITDKKGWVKTLDNFAISIDGKKSRIGFCDNSSKVYSNNGKYYAEIRWDDPNTEEYTEEFNALTFETLVNHRIMFDDDIDSIISIVKDIDNEDDDDSNIVKVNVISMIMYSPIGPVGKDPEFESINLLEKVDQHNIDYANLKIGDYAICNDEYSRNGEYHVVKITSIEYDMENSTEENLLGKTCYVEDLGDWSDDYVGSFNIATYVGAISEKFALNYREKIEASDDCPMYEISTRRKATGEGCCYISKVLKKECDFETEIDQGNCISWQIHEYHFTLKAAVERALTPFDEIQFDNVPQEEIDALNPNKPKTDEKNKKFILIRTDGYSIEESGRYGCQEDAHKAMETEYNKYNGNVPEEDDQWLNESGIYDRDAILYNRGDNVYVWKIIAA